MFKKIFLISAILASLFLLVNSAKAQPATISNLSCRPDISEGSIWLSWTVPSGIASSSAYDIRYVQGNTLNFDTARIFSQNWPSGSVGIPKQELVKGLNPGTQFTFAIKSRDESGNWSAASNQATCLAPMPVRVNRTPPQSIIIAPTYNAIILAGERYVISGTAIGKGGSSIQKMEVSLDNGNNWSTAKITDATDNNYLWEFVWPDPTVGQYKIISRATDWVNNVEIPGQGIPVQVVVQQIIGEKPTGETTIEGLKIKIFEIQTKIIELLRQLINIYQGKINQIPPK